VRFDAFPGCADAANPLRYEPQSFGEALAAKKKNYDLPKAAEATPGR